MKRLLLAFGVWLLVSAALAQNPGITYSGVSPAANDCAKFINRSLVTTTGAGCGTGSVTSVGLALPSIFTVSGSPVTTSGTLTGSFNTQAANTVFAGPTTGVAATPTFRALVAADVPASILPGSFSGFANPSASVGLSAVNGSATTAMRSDAAPALDQTIAPTMSGRWVYSAAGAASLNAITLTGAPFAGTGTTSFPLFYLNAGAAPTTLSTAGTYFGVNAASGFTGNYLDFHLNGGASVFSLASSGNITSAGSITAGNTSFSNLTVSGGGLMQFNVRGVITSSAAGTINLGNADGAAPVAQTLRAQSVVAGTSNTAGQNWTLIGSLSTGSGTSGDIILRTGVAPGAGSSTTQATVTTALTIKGETQTVQVASGKSLQLGNAYVGTPCANTGTVTLLDSAGTTLRVMVCNP